MMLAMEEVLCELSDHENKQNHQGLPPGFRFHPTDEELITFYLASKVFHAATFSTTTTTTNVKFAEVDLNRCEPWELPEVAKMGEREWYLFSVRDRKYPTGLRTNRATGAGYWKATGKDKEVYSNSSGGRWLVGMKKTLVFYKGRAPRGEKTKWVMHEYRLDGHFSPFSSNHSHSHSHSCKEEWVICRIFHKSGEKRTSLLQVQVQGQQHYFGASSISSKKTTNNCLLASPTSFTSSTTTLEHESQNDHFSLSPHLFPLQDFPIASATNTTIRNHPSSDQLLFKSHHLIKQTIPKTEATFYDHYQSSLHDHHHHHHANNNNNNNNNSLQQWMDINHSTSNNNNFQNSFSSLDMDYSSGLITFSGGSAAAVTNAAEYRDIVSSSIPFNNRVVALDNAPIVIDSWPQAQLV